MTLDRFVRGVLRCVAGIIYVPLLFIGVFVMVGPWWTLRAGLPGATLLMVGLGLFFDAKGLDVLLEWLPARVRSVLLTLAVVAHLVALVWAVVLMVRPLDPAWTPLEGTEDWNDPRIVAADGAWFVLTGSGRLQRLDDAGWHDLGVSPGGFAWDFVAAPDETAVWSAPRGVARLDRYDLAAAAWRSIGRPDGELSALTVGTGELLVLVGGALHHLDMSTGTWSEVHEVPKWGRSAALAGGGDAVVTGHRWWSREAGVWIDRTPDGELDGVDAACGGGWRYAWSSGLWSSDLWAAPPGGSWQQVTAPGPDVRTLVVHPVDGARVVAGTWGQGVFLTVDGGRTWSALGLDRVQVRSVAVDWDRGVVCAASSNTIWDRGLFCRNLPHGQPSGGAVAADAR